MYILVNYFQRNKKKCLSLIFVTFVAVRGLWGIKPRRLLPGKINYRKPKETHCCLQRLCPRQDTKSNTSTRPSDQKLTKMWRHPHHGSHHAAADTPPLAIPTPSRSQLTVPHGVTAGPGQEGVPLPFTAPRLAEWPVGGRRGDHHGHTASLVPPHGSALAMGCAATVPRKTQGFVDHL